MNAPRRRVAVVAFSPISRDARVLRQVDHLSTEFLITVVGYGQLSPAQQAKAEMLSVKPPTGLGFMRKLRTLALLPLGRALPHWAYEAWYWKRPDRQAALSLLLATGAEVIHANDWETLPIAVKASEKTGAQVILDLHEYSPLQYPLTNYRRWLFGPMATYFLHKHAGAVTASVTVGKVIARRYAVEFGLDPVVVMNAPTLAKRASSSPTSGQDIKLVHHGIAVRERKLELMIEMLAHLDPKFTLHLFLIESESGYISELQDLSRNRAPGRVFFHEPVAPDELISRLSSFDIGVFLLPPRCFNHAAALPNKFFDFIAAGLAVCIGPSPEMARLTQRFGFGIVTDSFEPQVVASALNSLTPAEIDTLKRKAIEARSVLNADVEMEKLLALHRRVAGELSGPGNGCAPGGRMRKETT